MIPCSKPKIIALFSPSLGGGGAERVLLNLAGGLINEGIGVDVVLASATGVFLAQLPPEVRVIDLKASRIVYSVLALARYLREVRPDALLAFQDHAGVAAIVAAMLSRSHTPIFPATHHTWTKILENCGRKERVPVSYTHLDVYKRQLLQMVPRWKAIAIRQSCFRRASLMAWRFRMYMQRRRLDSDF